jgi:dihydroorotase
MEPDIGNIAKGVTTALDTGSAGATNFPAFRRYVLERADTRLFALLNISAMGMIWPRIGELTDLRWADVPEAVRVGRENRDFVLGIKARLSKSYAGENDVDSLKRSLEAAEAIGGFVMIHVKDTKTPLEQLTPMLRPGDVVTHAFHGKSEGVLDDAGRVIDRFREDQQRGVIFDIGHGSGSFSFDVAEKAMSQDFFPDNISSDLYNSNVEGPVFDLVTTLSKFLWLGMSLYEVIRLSTETAAQIMGLEGRLGTLKVGAEGDVAILRLDEGKFTLTDANRVSVKACQKLNHVRTVKKGRIYRPWLK